MSLKMKIPRSLFAVFLLVFVPGFGFSYDGTVWGGYDGNFTRYNFIQQASNIDVARDVIRGIGNNITINKLFSIGEDDVDEEDVQMVNDNVAFITKNFRVNNGDGFSYIRLVQQPGWLSHKSCRFSGFL